MIVIGNSIAPTGTSNQKVKTWNIKSPNGFRIIIHTTLKNVGLLNTKLTINGSRNQIEDCVFSEADMQVMAHCSSILLLQIISLTLKLFKLQVANSNIYKKTFNFNIMG